VRIRELWSLEDRLAEQSLLSCLDHDDLIGCLCAAQVADEATTALVRNHVERWARQVAEVPEVERRENPVGAMQGVLVHRARFRGAVSDYNSPSNTRISDVILNRRGMPIMLSAIWIAVGRLAGVPVVGLGLPFHFVVRVGGTMGDIVDPFVMGRTMTVEECKKLVESATVQKSAWDDRWLEPLGTPDMVRRCLRNMERTAAMNADHDVAYRTTRLLLSLEPDDVDLQFLVAAHAAKAGAHEESRAWCHAIIRAHAGTQPAFRAAGMLQRTVDPSRN
jgi:regulator of sirC expression with transglutaminase-like and TPR domain